MGDDTTTKTNDLTHESQTPQQVSKQEFDAIASQVKELRGLNETLKQELDNTKLDLLSPEYLEYLGKKDSQQRDSQHTGKLPELSEMSPDQLSQYINQSINSALTQFSQSTLTPLQTTVENVIAREQVRYCESKYPDFNEHRDDIIRVIKTNPHLGIEDAYKSVVGEKHIAKTKEEKERETKSSREKPGGPAFSSAAPRDFKSKNEAIEDAWDKVVGDKNTL